MTTSSKHPAGNSPWPAAVALLSASTTTLLGIAAGHEPETVLVRSLASAVATYLIARVVRSAWTFVGE